MFREEVTVRLRVPMMARSMQRRRLIAISSQQSNPNMWVRLHFLEYRDRDTAEQYSTAHPPVETIRDRPRVR